TINEEKLNYEVK
ncbi:unnamed protein product, partial [Allacma fusca]